MHNAVAVLVRAATENEALDEADIILTRIKEKGQAYDGFQIERAHLYESDKGKTALQVVFGYQTIDFNENLAEIRKRLTPNKTEAELMEDNQFKFHCYKVGDSYGSGVRVWGPEGDAVQDMHHLKNIVDDWPGLVKSKQHVKSKDPLWVVTADGHY